MNWRLRKPDGTIYGPVAFPEFYRWAAEGRILPEDTVSEGDGDWRPAAEIPALELDWLLPRGEGQALGPLHLLAFGELLQQRMLQGNEPVVRKSGGESVPVGQAVAAELLRRLDGALKDLASARVEARTARLAAAKLQTKDDSKTNAELERAQQRASELHAKAEALAAELETLRSEQANARDELERLREQAAANETRLSAAIADLAQAREELARARDAAREAATAPEPLSLPQPERMDAKGREKEFQDLTRRYERLLARTREEADRNTNLQRALETERAEAARRQSELEQRLREAQEQVASLNARIEEQERHYTELVRNFRDLNDRYVRLRSESEKKSDAETPTQKPKVRLV